MTLLIVLTPSLVVSPPAGLPAEFAIVLGLVNEHAELDERVARRWVDAGARQVVCWGQDAELHEETFDYSVILPELGPDLDFVPMTTAHTKETFEQALWFGSWVQLRSPFEQRYGRSVVAIVDTPQLAQRAREWFPGLHGESE